MSQKARRMKAAQRVASNRPLRQLSRAGYWATVCVVLRALRALCHPLAQQIVDILT
jgi:hypothetical protein